MEGTETKLFYLLSHCQVNVTADRIFATHNDVNFANMSLPSKINRYCTTYVPFSSFSSRRILNLMARRGSTVVEQSSYQGYGFE
jgi:hypothetical protein